MTSRRPLIPAAVAAAAAARARRRRAGAPADARLRPRRATRSEQPIAFTGAGLHARPAPVDAAVLRRPAPCAAAFDDARRRRRRRSPAAPGRRGGRSCSPTSEDRARPRRHGQRPHARRRRARRRESQFGAASSRSPAGRASRPAATSPGRKVAVEAFGWAFADGQPLYFLLPARAARTVASVKRRHARARTCGDLDGAHPRAAQAPARRLPGSCLSTQKRTPAGRYTWRKGRVVKARRGLASAAAEARDAPRRLGAARGLARRTEAAGEVGRERALAQPPLPRALGGARACSSAPPSRARARPASAPSRARRARRRRARSAASAGPVAGDPIWASTSRAAVVRQRAVPAQQRVVVVGARVDDLVARGGWRGCAASAGPGRSGTAGSPCPGSRGRRAGARPPG